MIVCVDHYLPNQRRWDGISGATMAAPADPEIIQREPEHGDHHRSEGGGMLRDPSEQEQDGHITSTAAQKGFSLPGPNLHTQEVLDKIAAHCENPSLNILVVGKTGVGKTTFIEGLFEKYEERATQIDTTS